MKTTIEIADGLLRRARQLAQRRGTTLRAVVEDALRAALEADAAPRARAPIKAHTVGGRGLQAGLSWHDWSTLRSLAYEGRGG